MSFLAPLFLLGLLAIAIPIVLHRMNFSDPPSQLFSSTLLLKNSDQITATEKKLRYLILLASRILALLILVILFIQPALRSDSPLATGLEQRHNLIVLDQSLSMSAPGLWQQALDRAEARIDAMGENETAQIIGASSDIHLLTEATADRGLLKQSLNRLEPEFSTLDYGQLVQILDDLAATSGLNTRVYFISDLQATNLPVRFTDLVPRRALGMELDQVRPTQQSFNWSVNARLNNNEVVATVVSHSGPARQMQVDLLVEGQLHASQQLDIPASGSALAHFGNLDLDIDESRLQVVIDAGDSDALSADNQYFLSSQTNEPLSVLVLSAGTSDQSRLFLETALDSIANPDIDTHTIIGRADINLALTEYDLVILNDIVALSDSAINALKLYTERGGALLSIAGPATRNRGESILTGHKFKAVTNLGGATNAQGLLIQQPLHGAVSDFSGNISAKVYNPQEMEPLEGDQVIISTNNGYPWLVEHSIGLGRALVLSQSLLAEETDLSLTPEFVPLLRSWMRYLGGSGELPDNYQTGDQIQVGLDRETGRIAPVQQVFLPNGQPWLSLQQQNRIQSLRFGSPGIYGLQTSRGEHLVAVNSPLAESDLSPMADNLVAQWRNLAEERQIEMNSESSGTSVSGNPILKSFESWLLPLLLLSILVESILGNVHLKVRRETVV